MKELSQTAHEVYGLITKFVDRVPGVANAVVVSSDGLPLAVSKGLVKDVADQLATVAASLINLTQSASLTFKGGTVTQTVVEMERGILIVKSIGDGSCLAVLAAPDCDMGVVAEEMALVIERVGQDLTPAVRSELQASSPR